MKVVIAAAGTGGHINPGIAIANKIKEKEPDSEFLFIGTERGLEKDLVPHNGYELKTVDCYGVSRKLNFRNIYNLFKMLKSIQESKKILKEFKPDIVIGTGGYICVSVCVAARILKIPYVLHESNAFPGIAVKLLSKNAEKVFLGFEQAKFKLLNSKNYVVGTPTKINKIELTEKEKEEIKKKFDIDKENPLILVVGGSQGAKGINTALKEIIIKLNKEKNKYILSNSKKEMHTLDLSIDNKYSIIWSTGKKNYNEILEELKQNDIDKEELKNIKIIDYIYDMEELMNIADIIVARSGASTICDIEKVGKPSILIPYKYATENHQEYNARVLEKMGCAYLILDDDINGELLDNTITNMINKPERLIEMGQIAQSVSIQNTEEKIYNEIKLIFENERENDV